MMNQIPPPKLRKIYYYYGEAYRDNEWYEFYHRSKNIPPRILGDWDNDRPEVRVYYAGLWVSTTHFLITNEDNLAFTDLLISFQEKEINHQQINPIKRKSILDSPSNTVLGTFGYRDSLIGQAISYWQLSKFGGGISPYYKIWKKDGVYKRGNDLPSLISNDRIEFINGHQYHRWNGPAIYKAVGSEIKVEFWLFGSMFENEKKFEEEKKLIEVGENPMLLV